MERTSQSWDAALYEDKHAFVWKQAASLVELLAPQPGERILDLGCGTGHLAAAIAATGAKVIGLDQSAVMLEQARSAYPNLQFMHGDARNFSFGDSFDAVFSNAVLHWVRPPEAVIRCVRNTLKPGGRFVAEFGGRENVQAIEAALRLAARQMGIRLEEPLWYFPSVGEYATLLESAGLEVRFSSLFDRPTPLEGPDGLKSWVRMFACSVLDAVQAGREEPFLRAVEELARPRLFRDGTWQADYRRLRVVAVREG
jgi:trans-aconitate methyltransferase